MKKIKVVEIQKEFETQLKKIGVEKREKGEILKQESAYNLGKKVDLVENEKIKVVEIQQEFETQLKKLGDEKREKGEILKQESAKYENLESRRESITAAFNKANNKDIQLQETMTQMNTTRKKTKELIVEEKKKLEKLEKVPEESKQGIEECERKAEEMMAKKEQCEEEKTKLLTSLRSVTKSLQDKKEVLQNDLVVLKKSVDETKSEFTLAESELKIYVSNEENEKNKLENMKAEYETAKSTINERTKQVSMLKKKIPATEKSLREATEDLNKVKYEEAQVINEIRKNRSNMEEKKSSMQASQSKGKVLNGLMQQKREGKCPGFYGRLGDLGAIDQKYDVAISTACGALDNIIVDTVGTAQWCIEFLKKHDLGRATFIALDKQEHLRQQANTKIKTPENVHRLFDLVTIQDEDVLTAFYYALRDTLVANDLDQASRIAYGAQRFRVVSLNGDLIETTGTMSGGGRTVSRGRMGQSVRVSNVNPKELENLEETIQQLEQHVRELRQRQTTLESQINTLQPELRQMKFDYEKFSMELQNLKQHVPQLEAQLEEQENKAKSTKSNPAQVKKLTKIVDEKRALYETAAETAGALQIQVDEITKEIKAKTSGKMKVVEKNIAEATKTIDKCKAEITRLRVAVTTAERNKTKSEHRIKTMEQDVTDMETKLRQMKSERLEIEKDAADLLKCIAEIKEQLAEREESYSDIKRAVSCLTKKENEVKSEKVDIDQQIKTFNSKINDYKGAIHQLDVKISRLKLQNIPNEPALELKKYSEEEIGQINSNDIEKELEAAENHLRIAQPNLNAIEEYRKKQSVYIERSKELEEISNKRIEMRKLYDNLRQQRREEFLKGYNIIKLKLKEMYQMITLGGDADFEMVDTYDPFTEGIQFNVRPPKKSWKKISNLSGGEKTLSSLALVFALHYYKPSPLYVMDEIDAALDFKNVSIVGNYIKERTKNAQFIIISLRSNMFELCDNLLGIYKTYDATKTITIDPRLYDKKDNNDHPNKTNNLVQNCETSQRPTVDNDENTVADSLENSNLVQNCEKSKSSTLENNIKNTIADSLENSRMNSNSSIEDKVIDDSFQSSPMEVDS